MNEFMSDNFLLRGATAQRLYRFVEDMPIFDYHCHLSPREIYEDKKFYNLSELWLDSDHYKWRLMRAYGIDEAYITGGAPPKEKFLRFAECLPYFIGNPVYHWAHLELKKYFDLIIPIDALSAPEIWERTAKIMSDGSFSARSLIARSRVTGLVTTDDPSDDLNYHRLLKEEKLPFKVLPCFRPDAALNIEKPDFARYIEALGKSAGVAIDSFASLVAALRNRLDYFVQNGAVASDIAFADFDTADNERLAESAFEAALLGQTIPAPHAAEYRFAILRALAAMYAEKNIVMQLHTGVIRNVNSARYDALGADSGNDSVGNAVDITAAAKLFDAVERAGGMPKTILYSLNPADYYPLSTLLYNFAGGARGKMQLGAAWWFADHKDGIREQLKVLASTGGLGLFNGMLTDSRSFTSYARHDYFRRILCTLIGEWVEDGEYPDNPESLKTLLEDICYNNAVKYFIKEGVL